MFHAAAAIPFYAFRSDWRCRYMLFSKWFIITALGFLPFPKGVALWDGGFSACLRPFVHLWTPTVYLEESPTGLLVCLPSFVSLPVSCQSPISLPRRLVAGVARIENDCVLPVSVLLLGWSSSLSLPLASQILPVAWFHV